MRVRRFCVPMAALSVVAMVGCGGSELTVQVLSESAGSSPEANLSVTFLPYDRDALFAALTSEASSPEPTMPEDLTATFVQINSLQEQWRTAEAEWADTRDRLQKLSVELRSMDRRDRRYRRKFSEFNDLEARERRLDREKKAAFTTFDELQRTALTRADSVRTVLAAWEDAAFGPYADREAAILESLGREIFEDTTNAAGTVIRRLPKGDWWVHTRITTATGERYWNEFVSSAISDTLTLDVGNGEDRLRF